MTPVNTFVNNDAHYSEIVLVPFSSVDVAPEKINAVKKSSLCDKALTSLCFL